MTISFYLFAYDNLIIDMAGYIASFFNRMLISVNIFTFYIVI